VTSAQRAYQLSTKPGQTEHDSSSARDHVARMPNAGCTRGKDVVTASPSQRAQDPRACFTGRDQAPAPAAGASLNETARAAAHTGTLALCTHPTNAGRPELLHLAKDDASCCAMLK
jgi:hypothetical protein